MKKVLTALLSIVLFFSFSVSAFAGGGPFINENGQLVTYSDNQGGIEVTYVEVSEGEQAAYWVEQDKIYNEGVVARIFKTYVLKTFKSDANLTVDESTILDSINKTDDSSEICNLLKMYQGSEYFKQVFKLSQNVYCGTRYQLLDKKLYIFYQDGSIGVIQGNVDIPLAIISDYTGIHSENWENNMNILYKDDQVVIFDAGSVG